MEDSSPPHFDFVTAEKKESLLDAAIPKSAKTATHYWLSVFSEFCHGSESARDWKCIEEEDLAVLLENFYCSAKKQDKTDYKRASLIAARGAFQRHLNSLERGIDLQGPKFAKSNKLLDAVLKERKRAGQEAPVQHKESVTDEDWILLKEYFSDVSSTLDVKKVSQYVWFYTTLHFCLRGSEAQSQLKASDLVFSNVAMKTDSKLWFWLLLLLFNTTFLLFLHFGGSCMIHYWCFLSIWYSMSLCLWILLLWWVRWMLF